MVLPLQSYIQHLWSSETLTIASIQISEWVLLWLAYTFVIARVYTRLFQLRQRLDYSDYLLIASALDALGLIICDTLTFQMGVMDEYHTSEKLSKVGTERLNNLVLLPQSEYFSRSRSLPITSTILG